MPDIHVLTEECLPRRSLGRASRRITRPHAWRLAWPATTGLCSHRLVRAPGRRTVSHALLCQRAPVDGGSRTRSRKFGTFRPSSRRRRRPRPPCGSHRLRRVRRQLRRLRRRQQPACRGPGLVGARGAMVGATVRELYLRTPPRPTTAPV